MILVASFFVVALAANHPAELAAHGTDFGSVHFENSCSQSVQESWQKGVALLHSFEFGEATAAFHKVESADPSCTIAAWGVALANTEREGPDRPARFLATGWKELQPWLSNPAKTERERLYLEAVSKMYVEYKTVSADERWKRYIAAMRELRAKYPSDPEATIFYALALESTAGPGSDGIAQRREALNLLLPIFEQNPNHPGAAHYILHAADTPELAVIALPAARRYALIAPDSPHALHMPSHIFSRLGYWQESVDSNIASAKAASDWGRKDGLFDEQHALNHMEYAYLQLGQDRRAFEQVGTMQKLAVLPGGDPWWPIDARIYYDLDTKNWADAITIQPPSASPFTENIDVFWIQAIAAARLGYAQPAATFLDEFERSSSEFEKQHGWGDLLHLELLEVQAWALFAQKQPAKAVRTLQEAVKFEEDHPMYYPDVLPRPSAEMLGDMLILLGSVDKALDAYKLSLAMAPNRLNSLIGARDAASRTQHREQAAHYSAAIKSMCGADTDRPEAKAVLSGLR